MPIPVPYNGVTLYLPGAYSRPIVELNPLGPVTQAGVVGILGEADGGAPGSSDGVQMFSINQFFDITQKYISGPIVDAARLLSEPAKDPDVPSGASVIAIYKTNNSTGSSSTIKNQDAAAPVTQYNVASNNYGIQENQTNFYITEGNSVDVQANIVSSAITFPVTLTNPGTIVLNINGVAYTFTSPGAGPYADVAAVLAILNDGANWAPSKPVIASDGTGNKIKLTLDTSVAANQGYARRHEYGVMYVVPSTGLTGVDVDLKFRQPIAFASNGLAGGTFTVASLGGLAVGQRAFVIDDNSAALLGRITGISGAGPYTITLDGGATNLTAYTTAQNAAVSGTYTGWSDTDLKVTAGKSGMVRGSRGSRIFVIKKNTSVETIQENRNDVYFRIFYKGAGSAATMTIQDNAGVKKLTTVCTGAGSDNLNLDLTQYVTIQQLVDYINSFNAGASYVCVTDYFNAGTVSPSLTLDYYNSIDIRSIPLEVKGATYEILAGVNSNSVFMKLAKVSNIYGQVETISSTSKRFLTGASTGGSSNSSFQTGFDNMLKKRVNIVVPLVSQDASTDITAGNTDPSSTYTIASIHAQTDAHVRLASNTKNRSERNAYVGFKGTFAASKLAAQALNSEYTSLAIQDVKTLDASGSTIWQDPWMFAVISAGMQAGSEVGTPLTHKYMNIIGLRHSDFDPKSQYDDAIINGILFAQQPDAGGFRIALGNTTYLRDANQVFNRISVFEIVNYISYDLRVQLEDAFIGKSRASGSSLAVAIKTFALGILNTYTRNGLLSPDTRNKGLGYTDVSVQVSGDIVRLSVTITPAPGIDFILADITIAQVSDFA